MTKPKISSQLSQQFPMIKHLKEYQPLFWRNPDYGQADPHLPFTSEYIFDAVARWERFAPYLAVVFPETAHLNGIIESPLTKIEQMQSAWSQYNNWTLPGSLYLKQDNVLPISGSIKSRGGIYEVLKFAEHIALTQGDLTYMDDYSILATPRYHQLFSHYGITAGSTGNLGLSIGIAAASFGFQTTIHMSHDARSWKKAKLRANGVHVIEHDADCNFAVDQARKQAAHDKYTYFIDDEGSADLFLGYAVAAVRLQKQLADQHIPLDRQHPVFVYLPAGVGGSPSGVTFGLKKIMGPYIHGIFAEPTHVPSVTLGMLTGLNHDISVYDIGLDGKTAADGLAVSRPSFLAGKMMKTLLLGCATFNDNEIFKYLALLADSENINIEPSAAAGFAVIKESLQALQTDYPLKQATHIVWSTGGSMVPKADQNNFYQIGQRLLNN